MSDKKQAVWDVVVENLMSRLEQGVLPWSARWTSQTPSNYITGVPYRGINILLLSGHETPWFLTFAQASKAGITIGKGEKSSIIMVYKPTKAMVGDDDDDAGVITTKTYYTPWYYRVWNIAQTNADYAHKFGEEKEPDTNAEKIISGYKNPPKIIHNGDDPCYSPSADEVYLPEAKAFYDINAYYGALFHELVHSTGHETRLKRHLRGYFGSQKYSEEELVAEIGACYLRSMAGVSSEDEETNSASYVAGWHKRLLNDPDILKRAIMSAKGAADHIIGTKYDKR